MPDDLHRLVEELRCKISGMDNVVSQLEDGLGGIYQLRVELRSAMMCADPVNAREEALRAFVKFTGDIEVASLVASLPKRRDPLPSGHTFRQEIDRSRKEGSHV